MDWGSIFYLGTTIGLFVVFALLVLRICNPKRKKKLESPKHRMLEDDCRRGELPMAMLEKHEHTHAYHDFDGLIEIRVNPPPTYFSILFYGLIIWGAIFCAYFLLSGWSSEQEFQQKMTTYEKTHGAEEPPRATSTPAAAPAKEGEADQEAARLFADHCAACHGAGGEGGIGPDLTDEKYIYGRSLEEVLRSIRDGRPNGMPAFGRQLSAEEIESLAEHVLSL